MFRFFLILGAVSLLGVMAQGQAPQQVATSKTASADVSGSAGEKALESQLVANEQQLADSEKKKDEQVLQQSLAEDFIYVAYNGLVLTKDKIVKSLKYIDIADSQMENFKVRQIGPDAAVLTYDLMVHGAIAGHQLPQRLYASSVWMQKGG